MGLGTGTGLAAVSSGGDSTAATIRKNTPWQFLTKISADASTELVYSEIPESYRIIRILYDELTFSQNSYASLRVYLNGTEYASGNYQMAGRASTASTSANANNQRAQWRVIDNYESGGGRYIMGFTDIGGLQPDVEKQMASHVMSVHSSTPTVYDLSGYIANITLNRITGIKMFPDSGNFTSGSIKIYGMN
jgi:Ni,Fe-hydrogenase III large subunit